MAPEYSATGTPPMIGKRLSLAEWLDYLANYDFGPTPPTRVVLHHTYIPNEAQWAGLRTMQGMQRFYAGKGWKSAPHIYTAPDGVWLFTPLRDVGIHAGSGNSGTTNGKFWYSIGLETVGYFDHVLPGGPVWEQTRAILGSFSKRLGIPPRQLISFHRDYTTQKSCPGWAITKEWVFNQAETWLGNQPAPPPAAPGPVGHPAPEVEQLVDLLLDATYSRRGEGYNSQWAFHQHAVLNGLGHPIAKSSRITVEGKSYGFQAFALDTLYSEIPNWGDVRRLSELIGTSIPASGLGRALLEASYQAGGTTLRPDWAFHQYAMANKLGPPIGGSATISSDGVQYSYQVFAQDTLYVQVPNWQAVQRVSGLAAATDPRQVRLRDALLAQTYSKCGTTYHPEWAFHQLARTWNLGAPLSDSYRVSSGSSQYAIQVYATDTLYSLVPNWSDVRRLSALLAPRASVLGEEATIPITALLSADAVLEPAPAPFHIVQYAAKHSAPTAYSNRDGARVALIVLHGDRGPAGRSLERMTTPGARAMTHYYVTLGGVIYQLVDDCYATWHAGLAVWNGRRQNINRISVGVMVEYGPDHRANQLEAAAWLIEQLRQRHNLQAEAVIRWQDLAPQPAGDPPTSPGDLLGRQAKDERRIAR